MHCASRSLQTLSFFGAKPLDDATIHLNSLRNMLEHNTTLEQLAIVHSQPSCEVLTEVCAGLKHNATVTCLRCEDAALHDEHIEVIAEMLLVNQGLTSLSLDMQYTEKGMAMLARALQSNNSMRHVSLQYVHSVLCSLSLSRAPCGAARQAIQSRGSRFN